MTVCFYSWLCKSCSMCVCVYKVLHAEVLHAGIRSNEFLSSTTVRSHWYTTTLSAFYLQSHTHTTKRLSFFSVVVGSDSYNKTVKIMMCVWLQSRFSERFNCCGVCLCAQMHLRSDFKMRGTKTSLSLNNTLTPVWFHINKTPQKPHRADFHKQVNVISLSSANAPFLSHKQSLRSSAFIFSSAGMH